MTRDSRFTPPARQLDDPAIEQLVRDVAGEWTMPPVRLDAPGWRDRVRSRRVRGLDAASGWLGRLGRAASAAVALTVVAALVAVVITRPPQPPGTSPGASSSATATPSEEARSTPLPKLLVEGDLPDPTRVLVQVDGDFALADLDKGLIGGPLTGAGFGSDLRVESDGTMTCLCLAESQNEDGHPTRASVTFERYDANGKRLSSIPVAEFTGAPDPRDAGLFIPERPPHVVTAMSWSADGRFGFVGWSLRDHPAWRSGIITVDARDGSIVGRLALPDGETGSADARRVVSAPRVVGTTDDGKVLVARAWYAWAPARSEAATYTSGSDVFSVDFEDGAWADVAPEWLADDCGERVLWGGSMSSGGTWLACAVGGRSTVLRRIDGGTVLPDIRVSGGEGIEGDVTALSPDGESIFIWDPTTGVLTRLDIATGESRRSAGLSGLADGAGEGPLAAFGAWLAPTASAKSFLRGSVVVSPDGARVYAIGVKAGVDERDLDGSAGVFAFDAATLDLIGEIWQPTADYVSLALSSDGRFAYAAGLPGVDERGRRRADWPASITVFNASDGSIRLVAGALGTGTITFTTPTLD